jgi:hypothetical protein
MASSSKRRPKAVKGSGPVKQRVGAHRERLRAQGLRPIQIWVPDTRSPNFAKEVRRQCLLANASPHAQDDQAFIDSVSWFNSDEAR